MRKFGRQHEQRTKLFCNKDICHALFVSFTLLKTESKHLSLKVSLYLNITEKPRHKMCDLSWYGFSYVVSNFMLEVISQIEGHKLSHVRMTAGSHGFEQRHVQSAGRTCSLQRQAFHCRYSF